MKKYWLLFVAIGLTVVAVLTVNTVYNNTDGTSAQADAYRVLLLTGDETGSFYTRLKQGMEDEAGVLGADIETEMLDDAPEEQIAAFTGEKYRAAVVYTKDEALLTKTLAALKQSGIPSITVGNTQGDYAVMQDTSADAQQLVNTLQEAGYTGVLVLEGDGSEISDAFIARWEGTVVFLSAPEEAAQYPQSCLVGFSSDKIRTLLEAKAEGTLPETTPFYCCDTGTSRATDLETGYIQGMLVSRPYKIGCLAMDACDNLNRKTNTETITRYASCIITPENMYDAENVDIMFPLLL